MGDITEGVNAVFYISLCTILCTSISLAFKYCYKSKCKEVSLCCLKIVRDVDIEKEEDLNKILYWIHQRIEVIRFNKSNG